MGGGGGSDSFPVRKKNSSFVKREREREMHALNQCEHVHRITFFSGSHQKQMSTDECVCRTPLINWKQQSQLNLATLIRTVLTHHLLFFGLFAG